MRPLAPYERTTASWYYGATSLATLLWHAAMVFRPDLRPAFVGSVGGVDFYGMFIAPDLVAALVVSTWTFWLVRTGRESASALAWLLAGGQGYAFLISCWLAVHDPRAYWGMLAMAFSSGTALMFATRLSRVHVLWGPFNFQPAASKSTRIYALQALGQTAAMWGVFLLGIPWALAVTEIQLGFDRHWFQASIAQWSGVACFLGGATLGLFSGKAMTSQGCGTPLPSSCATNLVLSGPYRRVRNPMALGGIVQGVGVGLVVGSPLILLYALLGGIAWNTLVRPLEETYLEETFGESYVKYRNRVRCWVPTLKA